LKDLVRIDNIASEINEKRRLEIADIEKQYEAEIESLKARLEMEKSASIEYIKQVVLKAEEEARLIQESKKAVLEAMEARYSQVKQDILEQTVKKLFGVEMD